MVFRALALPGVSALQSPPSIISNDGIDTTALADVYGRLECHGSDGPAAARRLRAWISGELPFVDTGALVAYATCAPVADLYDEFWRVLPFGTGGRRGAVGFGSNRVNRTTVALTIQGHCDYLRQQRGSGGARSVVVANDVRRFHDIARRYTALSKNPQLGLSSRDLAVLAAEIYTANGITVHLARIGDPEAVLTTPELSFAIRSLQAAGGVNFSASHNHPDDNGIKLYDERGGQPVPPLDQSLADVMEDVSEVRHIPFEEARRAGLVEDLPQATRAAYRDTYRALPLNARDGQDTPIVYTPLCGSGGDTVGRMLSDLGFEVLTPADQGPDGSFAAIPFRAPNPEVPEATRPAREFADAHGVGIVLATDPDADRIGLDVKDSTGAWRYFTGNQIATIIGYLLLLDEEGPRRRGLVIETVVTTRALRRIVDLSDGSVLIDDLLVGFKYVAEVLRALEETGNYRGLAADAADLVLAAEESHGVLLTPTLRDKDAVSAAVPLATLHARLVRRGLTLVDYYETIVERVGAYAERNRSIVLLGDSGVRDIDRLMTSLRADPPSTLGGREVLECTDYWDAHVLGPLRSDTDRLSRNVLRFETDAYSVTVRPSGTEPKLKLYCQLDSSEEPASRPGAECLAAAQARVDEIADAAYRDLLARIDVQLSHAALALPDLLPLSEKLRFDAAIAPELRGRLLAGSDPGELADWLRTICSTMTPGADPLAAVKLSIGRLLEESDASLGLDSWKGWVDAW